MASKPVVSDVSDEGKEKIDSARNGTGDIDCGSVENVDASLRYVRSKLREWARDLASTLTTFVDELPTKGTMSVFDSFRSFVLFYMLSCFSAYLVFIASVLLGTLLCSAGFMLIAVLGVLCTAVLIVLSSAAFGLITVGTFLAMTAIPSLLLFVVVNLFRSVFIGASVTSSQYKD